MKYKRIKYFLSSMLTIFAVFTVYTHTTYAVSPYLEYGSASRAIYIQDYEDNHNATWNSIISSAISAWNDSAAVVGILISDSSDNYIVARYYSDTWYGLATQTYNSSTGYTTEFNIKINSRTIYADAANFTNFSQSTIVHEFGHIFWLCDNPETSEASIMKYSRDRNTMISPQTYDISNVNKKYRGY